MAGIPAVSPGRFQASLAGTIRSAVAAACAAVALFSFWLIYAGWAGVRDASLREAGNLAESLAQQTGSAFDTTDAVLQRMYFWAALRGVGPSQRLMLRQLLSVRTPSMQGIDELAFFDAFGNRVVRSDPARPADVRAIEARAFAWHAAHLSLAPLVLAPAAGEGASSDITLSRRFNDRRGRFAGMVVATIAVDSLRSFYEPVDVGRAGAIGLMLSDGTIVVRKPFDRALSGSNRRDDQIASRARASVSGTALLRSPIDGRERLVAFHRVARFPLIVRVGFATSETFAQWRFYSIVGVVALCAVLGTIVLLTRGLLAELRRNALAQARLSHYASRDGLTDLFNRRELDGAIEREWYAALADGSSLALLMIDVDFFKTYNDRYGHQSGDEALRAVAECLRRHCTRPRDFVARYGGEEFAVLLPATPLEGALLLAEKIRRAVEARAIAHDASPYRKLTVSVGVAEISPSGARKPSDLVALADALLYEAKNEGRNCAKSLAAAPNVPDGATP